MLPILAINSVFELELCVIYFEVAADFHLIRLAEDALIP